MRRAKNAFGIIFYSFPVQLGVLLFKKNQVLLLYWICLYGFVSGNFANKLGIPYLFLDPEYMGVVDIRSMIIMGLACGGFIMAFTISSYILNGFRFHFIAALSRPFQKYFLNNFIVPLTFTSLYLYEFIHFQLYSEFQSLTTILLETFGFLTGTALSIVITLTYFFSTDKNIFRISGYVQPPLESRNLSGNNFPRILQLQKKRSIYKNHKEWRVDSYLVSAIKARLTRSTGHYDKEMLALVSKRNHIHAALIELFVFVLIILLGLFREYAYFRIPAGASIFLLFSMLMMLTSAYRFWLRGWSMTVAVSIFLILNVLSTNDYFSRRNQAYGINYQNSPVPFNNESIRKSCSSKNYQDDVSSSLKILENWKNKSTIISEDTALETRKPKIVFLCTSGGGLRSAMWTIRVLQVSDSLTEGKLYSSTQLITGASGGTIGAAYFREIYLKNKLSGSSGPGDIYHEQHLENISKDLLNPVAMSIAVNDIFLNFQQFSDGKQSYRKDRAYEFEKQLNENTGNILNKKLNDYKKPEMDAIIPMMVCTPTIVNDGRRLFISALPVSYLISQNPTENSFFNPIVEGVEFTRFFGQQDAGETKFTSILRMNSTFPYVMPTVSLPSEPLMQIMDAGMRDNFGIQTTLRFLFTFRDWISKNTGGVVIVQIRDTHKERRDDTKKNNSLLTSITTPLENFYANFSKVQDYNQEELCMYANSWYKGKIDFVTFQLPETKEKISLSWHLTSREKQIIYNAINLVENQESLLRLKNIFEIKN